MLKKELKQILEEEHDLSMYSNNTMGMDLTTIGNSPSMPLIIISNTKKNSMSINEMADISDDLFELVVEFTSTPTDEREEEEEEDRYSVFFLDFDNDKWYIEYNEHTTAYGTVHWSDYVAMDDSLTYEQVENLPDRYHPDNGFTKIKREY